MLTNQYPNNNYLFHLPSKDLNLVQACCHSPQILTKFVLFHSFTSIPFLFRSFSFLHSGEYKKKKPKEHEQLFIGNQYNRNQFSPIGLFRKVPKERGHLRTVQKLGPFVRHFDGPNGINTQLKEMLDMRGFKAGSDVVVMVINEGEIDLFLNFVCSCHLHNITTSNVLVFAGSKEIITMIESTGAMGIYHEGYSSVSKKASTDYLDRPFVDMMWYKAFSVYLVLRLKINVLFQDVDLVWFRDPFPVFHNWTGRDGIPLHPPNKVIHNNNNDYNDNNTITTLTLMQGILRD